MTAGFPKTKEGSLGVSGGSSSSVREAWLGSWKASGRCFGLLGLLGRAQGCLIAKDMHGNRLGLRGCAWKTSGLVGRAWCMSRLIGRAWGGFGR